MAVETGESAPDSEVLLNLVHEYSNEAHTPELIKRFWETFLAISIRVQRLDIPVPIVECDRTTGEELEALKEEGRMWVPETGLTLPQLGQIFPEMSCSALQDISLFKDVFIQDAEGVDVEASIQSPNRDTTERGLKRLLKEQGRRGMRLSTFILASQISKLLTNEYLDENAGDKDITWSRVLGTRYEGGVIDAFFDSSGRLYLHFGMDPQHHSSGLGGRSEGVKKVKRRA